MTNKDEEFRKQGQGPQSGSKPPTQGQTHQPGQGQPGQQHGQGQPPQPGSGTPSTGAGQPPQQQGEDEEDTDEEGVVVAPGISLTSSRGVLAPGTKVTHKDFQGGQQTVDDLLKGGSLVKGKSKAQDIQAKPKK